MRTIEGAGARADAPAEGAGARAGATPLEGGSAPDFLALLLPMVGIGGATVQPEAGGDPAPGDGQPLLLQDPAAPAREPMTMADAAAALLAALSAFTQSAPADAGTGVARAREPVPSNVAGVTLETRPATAAPLGRDGAPPSTASANAGTGVATAREPVPSNGVAPAREPVPTNGVATAREPVPSNGVAPARGPVPSNDIATAREPVSSGIAPWTPPASTETASVAAAMVPVAPADAASANVRAEAAVSSDAPAPPRPPVANGARRDRMASAAAFVETASATAGTPAPAGDVAHDLEPAPDSALGERRGESPRAGTEARPAGVPTAGLSAAVDVRADLPRVAAPATVAAEPAAPVEPREVVPQVVRAARVVVANGGGEMHVDLRPPALGGVRVSASARGESVELTIHAERPETRALLAQELPAIQQALAERGVGAIAVTVAPALTPSPTTLELSPRHDGRAPDRRPAAPRERERQPESDRRRPFRAGRVSALDITV